jgi:lipopolysaccharide export LptBFGC system permease protein LptF
VSFGPLAIVRPGLALGIALIVLALVAGLLSAAGQPGGPLVGQFWIPPVVAAITALATLLKGEDS